MKSLPKTRSGKILRGTIRKICNGVELASIPATIDDAEAIPVLKQAVKNFFENWMKNQPKE